MTPPSVPTLRVGEQMIAIPDLIDALDRVGTIPYPDIDGVAHALVVLRDVASALAAARKRLEQQFVAYDVREHTHPDLGTFKRRRATRRTGWDHPRLAQLVAARGIAAREPDEDGEVPAPEHAAVAAVLAAAQISAWRVGVLRALDIDPDRYCDLEDEGYAVELPARTVNP